MASKLEMNQPEATGHPDEEACGKLWEVYANEAQRYDEGLVKSWKEDMDVILVFSGLYSAILTAFVIESYQTLQEDPADTSAALLKQISVQLGSLSNQTQASLAQEDPFTVSRSALACNLLWFLSLSLALCCSFLATLVQQWTRQFLHRTTMMRSSTGRARLVQFLSSGLRDLKMDAVVDIIPSLLHISLFSFLAGLVAFLNTVNSAVMWLIAVILIIIMLMYIAFTILPVVKLSSPYRTPLSSIAWQIWGHFRSIPWVFTGLKGLYRVNALKWSPVKPSDPEAPPSEPPFTNATPLAVLPAAPSSVPNLPSPSISPNSAVSFADSGSVVDSPQMADSRRSSPVPQQMISADQVPSHSMFEPSVPSLPLPTPSLKLTSIRPRTNLMDAMIAASRVESAFRDEVSIKWTLSSLNDDVELLPFVEALPDVLYGPSGLRSTNFYLIKPLLETNDPQCDIISRVHSLMKNGENSWFDESHRKRCRTICPRILWILACMLIEHPDKFDLPTLPGTSLRRLSWFSNDQISTLLERVKTRSIDIPCALSAGVLCSLCILENALFSLRRPGASRIPTDHLEATLGGHMLSTGKISYIRQCLLTEGKIPASMDFTDICQDLYKEYLFQSPTTFPYQFEYTASLLQRYLSKHSSWSRSAPQTDRISTHTLHILSYKLEDMGSNPDQPALTTSSLADSDRIFSVAFDGFRGTERRQVARYLTLRVQLEGPMSTTPLWGDGPTRQRRLRRCCELMCPSSLDARMTDGMRSDERAACQELILCMDPLHDCAEELDALWAITLGDVPSISPDSSDSSLEYFIKFMALKRAGDGNCTPSLDRIFDRIFADMKIDPHIGSAIQDWKHEDMLSVNFSVVVLMQLLRQSESDLSSKAMRDALEYYYHLQLQVTSGFLMKFDQSKFWGREFADCTKLICLQWIESPSLEKLQIMMMVWSLWLTPVLDSPSMVNLLDERALETLLEAASLTGSPGSRTSIENISKDRAWRTQNTRRFYPFDYSISLLAITESVSDRVERLQLL